MKYLSILIILFCTAAHAQKPVVQHGTKADLTEVCIILSEETLRQIMFKSFNNRALTEAENRELSGAFMRATGAPQPIPEEPHFAVPAQKPVRAGRLRRRRGTVL